MRQKGRTITQKAIFGLKAAFFTATLGFKELNEFAQGYRLASEDNVNLYEKWGWPLSETLINQGSSFAEPFLAMVFTYPFLSSKYMRRQITNRQTVAYFGGAYLGAEIFGLFNACSHLPVLNKIPIVDLSCKLGFDERDVLAVLIASGAGYLFNTQTPKNISPIIARKPL